MTLDQTWPAEAAELGLTVRHGHPDWVDERCWETPLSPAEGLVAVREAMLQLGFLEAVES